MLHLICLFSMIKAFNVGLYGPKIVWIFYGWYNRGFWRRNLDDVDCTENEMEQAVEGAFFIGYYYRNRLYERGIAGLTGKVGS